MAVALLAALTYMISRDGGGQQTNQLSEAEANLRASEIISLAASVRMAVDQMNQWGVKYEDIRFDEPSDSGYTTNTSRQIMHPAGGGITLPVENERYFKLSDTGEQAYGWTWKNTTNVEWSKSSANDVIFSAGNLRPDVCTAINKQLTGSNTLPILHNNFQFREHFSHRSSSNIDFMISECSECDKRDALCMYRPERDWHQFYSLAGSR